MSIRLRQIEGVGLIAICAARSVPKAGDVYLDDTMHHALTVKFEDDFASMGMLPSSRGIVPEPGVEDRRPLLAAMDAEESNNPNRAKWDRRYVGSYRCEACDRPELCAIIMPGTGPCGQNGIGPDVSVARHDPMLSARQERP